MTMTVDTDGKFLLQETSSTKKYTKELNTAGKYVDRNIKIDVSAQDGVLSADVDVTSGSASMGATGFTQSTEATDFYVSLNTTSGSASGKAKVTTAGWIDSTDEKNSGAKAVSVSGDGSKLYIPVATVSGIVTDLTAPSVSVSGVTTGFTASSTTTDYYVSVNGSGTNGSVKAKVSVDATGMVNASSESASTATTITPTISGSGAKVYIPAGALDAGVSGNITFTPSVSTQMTTIAKPATGTLGTDYFSITGSGTKSGTVSGTASVATEGYVKDVNVSGGAVTGTIATNDVKYIAKAGLTASGSASASISVAPGTVSIGTSAAAISSGEKLALTPTTNTASISDYYIPLKATATANTTGATGSISGSATASISSAGYAVKDRTANGPISGTAIAKTTAKDSSDYYIPVAKTTYSSALPTGMAETDFTDISSSAPALVSGGYLYIKEGYNKNQKISLAKLVPDKGTIVGSSSDAIVSGESAYNNDGVLVSGSLAKASLSGALHANQTTTAGYDFYNVSMSKGHNRNGDVSAVQIPVYQGDWVV